MNPHPDAVKDPAFVGSEFFDPHDLVQVRYELLRRVHLEGQSVKGAVAHFGVTRPTFYRLQADFERAGLAGLLPAKRGPHGPHKVTPEVLQFVERARETEPRLDGPALVVLIQERLGVLVHRRTIERALAGLKKKRR